MAFSPFSAKSSPVRVGAIVVTSKEWNVDCGADKLDITNFEGAGFYEWLGGLKKCDVTIIFDIDAQLNPFDAAPSPAFTPGTNIATVKLYWNTTANPFWLFPLFFVEKATNPAKIKETGMLTITGAANGTFTKPTGNWVPT